jgi:hypothetical protein
LRTQKTVGSTVYNYYYADGLLIRQTWGSDFANNNLIDDAVKSIPKSFFGNNTQSRNAEKVIRKAGRFFFKSLGSSLIEDPSVAVLSNVTQISFRYAWKGAVNVMGG